jgi:hypothetical protein
MFLLVTNERDVQLDIVRDVQLDIVSKNKGLFKELILKFNVKFFTTLIIFSLTSDVKVFEISMKMSFYRTFRVF